MPPPLNLLEKCKNCLEHSTPSNEKVESQLDQLFEVQTIDHTIRAPVITPESRAYLARLIPLPDTATKVVKANIIRKAPLREVIAQAKHEFNSLQPHSQKYYSAICGYKTLKSWLRKARTDLARDEKVKATTQVKDLLLRLRSLEQQPHNNVLMLFWLILPLVVIILGIIAEFSNAIYLTQNAGLGFEESWIRAFLFSLPFVLATFVSIKTLEMKLKPKGQRRFTVLMNYVASPMSLIAMAVFCFTLGKLNHTEVSLFGEQQTDFIPPLWLLLGISMASLAVMITQLCYYVIGVIFQYYEFIPVDNAIHKDAAFRINQLNQEIAKAVSQMGFLRSIIKNHHASRRKYINDCLDQYAIQQTAIQAKQARYLTE